MWKLKQVMNWQVERFSCIICFWGLGLCVYEIVEVLKIEITCVANADHSNVIPNPTFSGISMDPIPIGPINNIIFYVENGLTFNAT